MRCQLLTEAVEPEERALLSPPPSPPPTPTRPSGIHTTATFTIEERNEPIPFRPVDEDPWVAFLLPPEQLCPTSTSMQLIKILPSIHVVNGHLVAAAFSRVRSLRGIGIPLRDVHSSDPKKGWQPSDDEIRIHGAAEAKRRFHTAISDSAAEAAISGHPKGLLRLYRMNAERKCVVRMEWEELMKDIKEAPQRVIDRFAVLCRHLGLRQLEREDIIISTESVKALLDREPKEWISELHRFKEEFCAEARSDRNLKFDGHVRTMLRAVVELAGGPKDSCRKEFDRNSSADENLAALGYIFGVDTEPGLVSVNGSDAEHARDLVLQALKPVTADAVDFRKLMDVIGFPISAHPNLPVGLLSSLSIQTITDCIRPSVLPDLAESPESVLPLFLCQHAEAWGSQERRLRGWMNTEEGKDGYSQITTTLKQTTCLDLMAPCLAAGLYYSQILGDADVDENPTHGSYLHRFFRELDARQPHSLAVWEHMACSFLRSAAGYDFSPLSVTALSRLEKTADWDLPFRSSMSDGYWRTRRRLGLSHEGACDAMARVVSSISDEFEAVKEYLAARKGKEDSGMDGGRAIDLYSDEEGEAVD